MGTYKVQDLKLLWGKAAGRCSFPKCRNELIVHPSNGIIGHIAHIIARSENGPRGNKDFPKEKLHSYENLILLCQHHHGLVDTVDSGFSVEQLLKYKSEHENWVHRVLRVGTPWQCNVSQFYYLNIPRLSIISAMNGYSLDFTFLENINNLHSLGIRLAPLLVQFKDLLSDVNPLSYPLNNLKLENHDEIGLTTSFNGTFRTKHVPGLDDYKSKGFTLSGDIDKDPQIYVKHKGFKIIMTIDPQWLTTTTSFVNLRPSGGRGNFAGLCTIKDIDFENKIVSATPIIIGIPVSPFDDLFSGNSFLPRTAWVE